MKLYLVRHGQTDWNNAYRMQGRTDVPLNDEGQSQAALLAQRLKSAPISAVYTSPLLRAGQTADIIAAHYGIAAQRAPLLIERDFGAWEGMTFEALKRQSPVLIKQWVKDPYHCTPPEAETLGEVIARCELFLAELEKNHAKDEAVLVVGHSVPLRLIITKIIGLPFSGLHSLQLDNVSISIVSTHPPVLVKLNDTAHIGGVP